MDPRIEKLANILVNYSCRLKSGDKVLIDCYGASPEALNKAIIRETYKIGAIPFFSLKNNSILREIIKHCSIEQLKLMSEVELKQMKAMNAYIGIRGYDNINELSDINRNKLNDYLKFYSTPVTDYRVDNTRWVVLRYPNNSMAQLANTSLEDFENFYFDVCNLDYGKMSAAMENLVKILNDTDKVRITGHNTDLSFSIKNIPAIKCAGENNIPDGEVFTAPVLDSVNGKIFFGIPQVHQGITFENIMLEFENGKIIKADCSADSDKLNKTLDVDSGARYLGEFALGVNPFITRPMKDGLFDEKIRGSIHFACGKSYLEADNNNRSAIHWDMISIQTSDFGGGEIYFDGRLIRKDGVFVIDELKCLNPENLM
jgi:aminopeptidase